MDVLVSFSSNSGSEAVSSLLTGLNEDSGIFLVIPVGLFILRATGSLLFLSFAGGDKARLVAPSHCDAAWAAVQHGITAAFAFEALQAAVEGVAKRTSQVACCAYRSQAREPVVMHPRVWDHEVPLVMSQVIQATGRRILHTWVVAPLDVHLHVFWRTTLLFCVLWGFSPLRHLAK